MTPAPADGPPVGGPPDDHVEQFDRYASRRRRKVTQTVLRGVLDAKGPSWATRMLWLVLWSYRKGNQVEAYQADLLALIGWPTSAREFRRAVAEGAGFNMWINDRGLHKPSLLTLHTPNHWSTVWRPTPARLPPPRGNRSDRRPFAVAAGAPSRAPARVEH
jgi:hypothetical protein